MAEWFAVMITVYRHRLDRRYTKSSPRVIILVGTVG